MNGTKERMSDNKGVEEGWVGKQEGSEKERRKARKKESKKETKIASDRDSVW